MASERRRARERLPRTFRASHRALRRTWLRGAAGARLRQHPIPAGGVRLRGQGDVVRGRRGVRRGLLRPHHRVPGARVRAHAGLQLRGGRREIHDLASQRHIGDDECAAQECGGAEDVLEASDGHFIVERTETPWVA